METSERETPELSKPVQVIWLAFVVSFIGLLLGLGVRDAARTDGRLAVENAVQQLQTADLAAVLVRYDEPDSGRTVPLRPADSRPLLLALRQLRPIAINPKTLHPQALATVSLRLTPAAQTRWHLRQPELAFWLAASNEGDIVQRPASHITYRSTLLNQRIQQLRDSLAIR